MTDVPDDIDDEAFGISDRLVADVMSAVETGQSVYVDALLDPLHPVDIAHLIELIDSRQRRDLLSVWKGGMDVIYRPVYNRLMRTPTCEQSYDIILGWDFEYIAPCHGEPVSEGAKTVLREHLSL